MDYTKNYNELADEIMEATWDIQDVMEGRNDFNESTVAALKNIKEQCEFFIRIYDEYINMKSSEIAETII
jgi:hypothetical protein